MAIQDDSAGQTQMSAAFGRAAGATTQAQATTGSPAPAHAEQNVGSGRNPGAGTQSNAGQPFSFRAGPGMRTMMSRSPASEVLTKLQKALEVIYKEEGNETYEFRLIPIDMNDYPELSVSALVLAAMDKQQPDLGVAFHTFILEGSVEAPASKFEQIQGKNVEIVKTVAEAFDENMVKIVATAVSRQFPQAPLYNAEAVVVPRDFKIDDRVILRPLAANAAFAVSQELQTKSPGFSDLNLANAQNDSSLVVRTSFNNLPIPDAVGQPLRTDIVTDFAAVPANQNNQQNLERQSLVSRMGGFMDIVWDAPGTPTGFGTIGNTGGGWGGQQANYQRYVARFVMTLLDPAKSLTLPNQLLALIPGLALREGNAWVQAFKPLPTGADVDMKDIGAIGYEVNFEGNASGYGDKIDTKSANFKDEHLYKLIATTFKAGMLMSLDVPECGPQTWYSSAFAAAAEGNGRAEQAILDAAQLLTAGNFGRYFPNGGRVAVDENNRIHLGHYTGLDGNRRDIRDVDYLAVLNLAGGRDPGVVKDFSDTYLRREYHIALRMSERLRIIRALFPDAVVTGYARRVTFTSEFINALASGAKDAGLTMRAATSFQDLGAYERASGAHLNQMLMGSDPVGVFNRGGIGGFGGGNVGNRSFGSRW
jgi:hypothetical protein